MNRIRTSSQWAGPLRRLTTFMAGRSERIRATEDVDSGRRSLVAMVATVATAQWLPGIVMPAHAAGATRPDPSADLDSTPDLLAEAFQSQPPASGSYGDGVTDATKPIQAVLDKLAETGGGDIHIPRGDYPLNIRIAGANIRITCDSGTVLRAANHKPVIDILPGADNVEISGPSITGQRKAQEGKKTAPNVTALHCIRTAGTNITVRQFSARAARQDGVYVKHVSDMDPTNLTLEDFDIGPTSRNPVSIIAARNTVLRRGAIRLDGQYAGNADVNRGYALFDLEPNNKRDKSLGIHFHNVNFINASTKSGTQNIMFGETHNGSDIYNVSFNNCRFESEGKGRAPTIRVRPKSKRVEKLDITNLVADGRVFINAAQDGIVTIRNSEFKNIVLGSTHFTYHVKIGSGCVLERIRSRGDKLSIPGAKHAARVLNVMGMTDRGT